MDKFTARTGIYHEHQEGALCGQHALNNLLQNSFFSADSLADIARELDKDERSVLTHTVHCSENMDDTGFFNIQVLQRALKMFNLELVSYASQEDIAKKARSKPYCVQAYICNLGLHWFTIRCFGRQYFNLNSIYYVPVLIPSCTLQEHFQIIQENGYSVFIVDGLLPDCVADQQLTINPIGMNEYDILTKDLPKLMIDGKTINDFNELSGYKNGKISIVRELYDEFQKNPHDPRVQQKLYESLPKNIRDVLDPTDLSTAKLSMPQNGRLLISVRPTEAAFDQQRTEVCICPNCRRRRKLLKEQGVAMMNSNFLQQIPEESNVITTYEEYIVKQPVSSNSNESSGYRMLITQRTITPGSLNRTLPAPMSNRVREITEVEADSDNEDDTLLLYAMNQSLDNVPKETPEAAVRLHEERLERINQYHLDIAIAASLRTDNPNSNELQAPTKTIQKNNASSPSEPNNGLEQTPLRSPEPTVTPPSSPISPINAVQATQPSSIQTSIPNVQQTSTVNVPLTPMTNSEPIPMARIESTSSMNSTTISTRKSEGSTPTSPGQRATQNPEKITAMNSSRTPTLKLSTATISQLMQAFNSQTTSTTNSQQTPLVPEERKSSVESEQTLTKISAPITVTNAASSIDSYSPPSTSIDREDINSLSIEGKRIETIIFCKILLPWLGVHLFSSLLKNTLHIH